MMVKIKITLLTLAFGIVILTGGCDDPPKVKKTSTPHIVSGTISLPVSQNESTKAEKDKKNPETVEAASPEKILPEAAEKVDSEDTQLKKALETHYISKGKTDPFSPLIQENPEEAKPVVDDKPKRILTPLEKIEIGQIRLVAVIIMKNKKIAMVEEASGKGYEVGIGTYIGKNQGKVSEIKNNSILVKELVKDYKGKLTEKVTEIKLHKNDNEE